MGKRRGRKITRKAKEQPSGGTAVAEASGYLHCGARGQRISQDVCIVKQGRTPKECRGCEHYRG